MQFQFKRMSYTLLMLGFLAATSATIYGQATVVSVRHESLSQQDIDVQFSEAVTLQGGATVGWKVSIGDASAIVTNVVNYLPNTVRVTFNASSIPGHPYAFVLPGENLSIRYDGPGSLVADGGVPAFNEISRNDLEPFCTDIIFYDQGDFAPVKSCSPVVMDFHQFSYKLSLRYRNSSTFSVGTDANGNATAADLFYLISWGDGTTENVNPYLAHNSGEPDTAYYTTGPQGGPGVIVNARPVHHYPAGNPGDCSFNVLLTPFINGVVACPQLVVDNLFSSYDRDNANTGALNLIPSVAGADTVAAGHNLSMQFSDETLLNCRASVESVIPNDRLRFVRFRYGIDTTAAGNIPDVFVSPPAAFGGAMVRITNNDSSGTFANANWFPVGDGGAGMPDVNGAIQMAVPDTASSFTQFSGTVTTTDAHFQTAGQRFYVALDYWDICNPYNVSSPNDPAPVTIMNYIEVKGVNSDTTNVIAAVRESSGAVAFPNPSSGIFYLKGRPDEVDVADVTGKKIIFREEFNGGQVKVTLLNPSPGIVIVKSFLGGRMTVQRVIVQP